MTEPNLTYPGDLADADVSRLDTTRKRRHCFIIPVDQRDENGYIPSLVTEGEPGHSPLRGNGRLATPWYWGKTYEAAKAVAAAENAKLGLTETDVLDIVCSSFAAGDPPPLLAVDPMEVYRRANELGGYFDCDDVIYCNCGRSWPVGMTYDDAHVQAVVISELTEHRTGCKGEA